MTSAHRSGSPDSADQADVIILGGGLAGLSLALQLRSRRPAAGIVVLERASHPVPEAAHKVGESTVEIGAHYFAEVLGLRRHLEEEQLRKYGLRFFFDAGGCSDLALAPELGASELLPVPSYQLDRGIFENHLGECARAADIEFRDAARVRNVTLAEAGGPHCVEWDEAATSHQRNTRWVVDAMGRASRLRRQLDLAEDNDHNCSAVWFRIDRRIDLGDWSASAEWQQRCQALPRWLSTNHLMGPGYWVWLIPLASGSTSVGIVFDDTLHDLDRLKTYAGALEWLERHQPRCRQAIDEAGGQLQDYRYLRNFSHGCRQVFSSQRWALTGEAGVFLDPFYSPGSDFIAISNTYITDLIERDLDDRPFKRQARLYQRTYFSFYDSSLRLYRDQYPLFGHFRAMSAKTIWDYAYYWGVLALLFFANRLTDPRFIGSHVGDLETLRQLNDQMQTLFRDWARHEPPSRAEGAFVDQAAMPLLVRLNRELTEAAADSNAALARRLTANSRMLRTLAAQLRALGPGEAAARVSFHRVDADDPEDLLAGLPPQMRSPVPAKTT